MVIAITATAKLSLRHVDSPAPLRCRRPGLPQMLVARFSRRKDLMTPLFRPGSLIAASTDLSRRAVIVGLGFGGIAATLAGEGWSVRAPAQEASPATGDMADELNAIVAIYGHPTDPAAFEEHYQNTHLPLVYAIPGVQDLTFHTSSVTPEGDPAENYRITTLRFASQTDLEAALMSAEGQAAVADLPNFATGGFTLQLAHLAATIDISEAATPAA
jgi:uncharacterized protein (TIGR02118 family)